MCGIFGLSVTRNLGYDEAVLTQLFELSESPGNEAAGVAIATSILIEAHKGTVSASAMRALRYYKRALDHSAEPFFDADASAELMLTAAGYARLLNNGLQGIDANNRSVRRGDVVIVHGLSRGGHVS